MIINNQNCVFELSAVCHHCNKWTTYRVSFFWGASSTLVPRIWPKHV